MNNYPASCLPEHILGVSLDGDSQASVQAQGVTQVRPEPLFPFTYGASNLKPLTSSQNSSNASTHGPQSPKDYLDLLHSGMSPFCRSRVFRQVSYQEVSQPSPGSIEPFRVSKLPGGKLEDESC